MNTRIEEHLKEKDEKSHIYSHLQENPQFQEKINFDCFEIIDRASSYFRLQINEAMHINWKNWNSTNRLGTWVSNIDLYIYIGLLFHYCLFLLIFFYLFFLYSLAVIEVYILIIYLLIFNIFWFYDFIFESLLQPCTLKSDWSCRYY